MISLLKQKRTRPGLLGIEKIGIIYALFTAAVALVFIGEMPRIGEMAAARAFYFLAIAALIAVYRKRSCHLTFLLRNFLQYAMLAVWYPETFEFCKLFGNFDNVFASIDQTVFGFQPALVFSETFHGPFWSELFNLGYFSYYPMIAAVLLCMFFRRYLYFEKTAFIILCSFLIYYIIFLFLPVAGPQFYYPAVGVDTVRQGVFPDIGQYFSTHTHTLPAKSGGGLFESLVGLAQASGERPTAAFPSSHIGISTILIIITGKYYKKLRLILLPFYVLLCFATVYIGAHYFIDAVAGFVTAFIVYAATHKLYYLKAFHRPHGYHT